MEIINTTQLPKILPKVLYIYTCHNDLINSRVLQNKNQTYKIKIKLIRILNFEFLMVLVVKSEETKLKIFAMKII